MEIKSALLSVGFLVTESAPGVYTQNIYSLPVSFPDRMGCIIREVLCNANYCTQYGAGISGEVVYVQVTEESKGAVVGPDDPDLIAQRQIDQHNNVGGTELIETVLQNQGMMQKMYSPEDSYQTLRDKIYVAIDTTDTAVARVCNGRINFNLVKFSSEEFERLAYRESFE